MREVHISSAKVYYSTNIALNNDSMHQTEVDEKCHTESSFNHHSPSGLHVSQFEKKLVVKNVNGQKRKWSKEIGHCIDHAKLE